MKKILSLFFLLAIAVAGFAQTDVKKDFLGVWVMESDSLFNADDGSFLRTDRVPRMWRVVPTDSTQLIVQPLPSSYTMVSVRCDIIGVHDDALVENGYRFPFRMLGRDRFFIEWYPRANVISRQIWRRAEKGSVPGEVVDAIKGVDESYRNTAFVSRNVPTLETRKSTERVDNSAKTYEGPVYEVVETLPSFPNGNIALMEFLVKNTKYPAEAKEKRIQGRVLVTFIVEPDGSVTNATVTRSVDELLDNAALRVVNSMPKWNPGRNSDGKAVRVKYSIPVAFRFG